MQVEALHRHRICNLPEVSNCVLRGSGRTRASHRLHGEAARENGIREGCRGLAGVPLEATRRGQGGVGRFNGISRDHGAEVLSCHDSREVPVELGDELCKKIAEPGQDHFPWGLLDHLQVADHCFRHAGRDGIMETTNVDGSRCGRERIHRACGGHAPVRHSCLPGDLFHQVADDPASHGDEEVRRTGPDLPRQLIDKLHARNRPGLRGQNARENSCCLEPGFPLGAGGMLRVFIAQHPDGDAGAPFAGKQGRAALEGARFRDNVPGRDSVHCSAFAGEASLGIEPREKILEDKLFHGQEYTRRILFAVS